MSNCEVQSSCMSLCRSRRWVKPSRKWRTPTTQVRKVEQTSSKPNTAGHVQAWTIKDIFIFGSATQEMTKSKSSLPTLQDLPSHQEAPGAHVKTTKKPGRWSTIGKSKIVAQVVPPEDKENTGRNQ